MHPTILGTLVEMCEVLVEYVLAGTGRGSGSTSAGSVILPQPLNI